MAIGIQSKNIDGMVFEVSQLSAWEAAAVFVDLTRLLGPVLGGAAKGFASEKTPEAKAKMASALLESLPDVLAKAKTEEVIELSRRLLGPVRVTINGRTADLLPSFEDTMRGRTLTVFKLVAFAAQVNFSDFFAATGSPGSSTVSGPTPREP